MPSFLQFVICRFFAVPEGMWGYSHLIQRGRLMDEALFELAWNTRKPAN